MGCSEIRKTISYTFKFFASTPRLACNPPVQHPLHQLLTIVFVSKTSRAAPLATTRRCNPPCTSCAPLFLFVEPPLQPPCNGSAVQAPFFCDARGVAAQRD